MIAGISRFKKGRTWWCYNDANGMSAVPIILILAVLTVINLSIVNFENYSVQFGNTKSNPKMRLSTEEGVSVKNGLGR